LDEGRGKRTGQRAFSEDLSVLEWAYMVCAICIEQSTLLRAIARERIVTAINSSAFMKKYGLKGSSSINTALKFLVSKEYVFKLEEGYCVYDRFMELWLQTLPYSCR
jgi:hypothetical protein